MTRRPRWPRRPRPTWGAVVAVFAGLALLATACEQPQAGSEDDLYRVGVLRAVGAGESEPAIFAELRAAGFLEGRNLVVYARDRDEAYPDPQDAARVLRGWAAQGLDLVLALSSGGAAVAREVVPDTPVLFISNDPTAAGLVADESSPEGTLTGVTFRVPEDRTLDLARRVVGDVESLGIPYPDGDTAAQAHLEAVRGAAEAFGVQVLSEPFRGPEDVASAVDRLVARGVGMLLLSTSPRAVLAMDEVGEAVERHQVPVVSNTHLAPFAVVAMFPDAEELGRQMGRQAARLLSGSPPSAVPVEDPRRYEVVIHRGVAARLGITVPSEALFEATRVVD